MVAVVAAVVVLGGFGWLTFVVPATVAAGHPPPSGSLPTSITVDASNFAFAPSTNELATNATITVTFIDMVSTGHTFTLSSVQGVAIPVGVYGDNVSNYFSQHPYYANAALNGVGQVTINFTAPAKGWYEFVCTVPGHFGLGMYNALGFGVPAPANLTGGGSAATVQVGWPVYVIAGTIVGLVVLALVLGFVTGQRKGPEHEMPPERLGYPEHVPPSPPSGPPSPPRPP